MGEALAALLALVESEPTVRDYIGRLIDGGITPMDPATFHEMHARVRAAISIARVNNEAKAAADELRSKS